MLLVRHCVLGRRMSGQGEPAETSPKHQCCRPWMTDLSRGQEASKINHSGGLLGQQLWLVHALQPGTSPCSVTSIKPVGRLVMLVKHQKYSEPHLLSEVLH